MLQRLAIEHGGTDTLADRLNVRLGIKLWEQHGTSLTVNHLRDGGGRWSR